MAINRTNVADKGVIDALNQHAGRIDVLVAGLNVAVTALNVLAAKLNLDAGVTDTDYAANTATVATTAADLVKSTGGA